MNFINTMLSIESKLQKDIYSEILFFKSSKARKQTNTLYRDSQTYSKIILKARKITLKKYQFPGWGDWGWAWEGVYKKMQCYCNV